MIKIIQKSNNQYKTELNINTDGIETSKTKRAYRALLEDI